MEEIELISLNSHSQTGAPGSPDLYSTEIVKICKLLPLHML